MFKLVALLLLTPCEENLLQYTNEARARAGLHELVIDPEMQETCRAHAAKMASMGSMHHAGPYRENIAMGQPNSRAAIATWLNSPPHRANLMARGVRYIAIAGYVNRAGRIYWCMRLR